MSVGETPVKKAIAWLDEQLREHPGGDRAKLIEAAATRFDLSPLDSEFLYRFVAERGKRA
jgi:hypothetical protein